MDIFIIHRGSFPGNREKKINILMLAVYSHLSNNRGGWNKRGGSAKVAKSINVEVGINVEGGIFWKKLVHKCNKRGVESGKNLRNQ